MLLRLLHLRRCCTPLLTLPWLLLGCRLLVLDDRRSLLRLTLTLCLRGLWRLRRLLRLTRGLLRLLMRRLWRLTRGLWLLTFLRLLITLHLWPLFSRRWLLTFNPRGGALLLPLLRLLLHCRWLLTRTASPIPLWLLTLPASRLLPALPLLLVVLLRYRVLRPIAVVLRVDDSLLLHSRISIS
jgi:hypothetical protein